MNSIPTRWLRDRAAITPNKTAIEYDNQTLTYRDLYDKAVKIASHLLKREHIPKRVALFMPNSLDTIVVIHALTLIKTELVIINARLTTEEVVNQLKQVNTRILITGEKYQERFESISNIEIIDIEQLQETVVPLATQLEHDTPLQDDILCNVFTSGTTGTPKVVPLTYTNFYFSAISGAFKLGVHRDDKWLMTMPMYHLGGLAIIFRACIYGTEILCHQGFQPEQIVKDLEEKSVTQISIVPTMLKRLLPHLSYYPKLRFVLVGGAKTPQTLIQQALEMNLPIATTYGMTETCSQIVTATPEEVRNKPESVGKPLLHSKIKVLNKDSDGIGEIAVKGPTVTRGYLQQETPKYQDYLKTGDLGYMDQDGDLIVLQRRTDLIISGGENIYPSEIEQTLLQIEEIDDVCVIPIDDDQWGQIPIAFLKLQSEISKERIVSYLQAKLAPYKLPKQYFEINEFPQTASGKIKRSKLEDMSRKDLRLIN